VKQRFELDELAEREPVPGFRVRFVHADAMTLAYWRVEAGAVLPLHRHPHEQVAHALEGELELTVEGDTTVLRPGVVVVVPPNAEHGGRALTPCRLLDVFHPVREDYR
jgi:quercetin dioxygenase-like cupin family protein